MTTAASVMVSMESAFLRAILGTACADRPDAAEVEGLYQVLHDCSHLVLREAQ